MVNNVATKTVDMTRFNTEFAYEMTMALTRNKTAVKAEYETGTDEKRVIIWAIGKITIEVIDGKKVYSGYLGTQTKYLGTKKGYMSRGAFAPIPFSYDPETKTIYADKGETKERRQCVANHVGGLMEKYLTGQTRINGAKTIEQLKSVRGYNQFLRDPQFTPFIKRYHGIVDMTPKAKEKIEKAETASLPDFD